MGAFVMHKKCRTWCTELCDTIYTAIHSTYIIQNKIHYTIYIKHDNYTLYTLYTIVIQYKQTNTGQEGYVDAFF